MLCGRPRSAARRHFEGLTKSLRCKIDLDRLVRDSDTDQPFELPRIIRKLHCDQVTARRRQPQGLIANFYSGLLEARKVPE